MRRVQSKRYRNEKAKVEQSRKYSVEEAVVAVKETASAKFDETVEAVFVLGIDPKRSDQMVKGAVVLPHSIGREIRVVVFSKGDKQKEAGEAGADFVGGEDLIEKIQGGWQEFDKVVATPDMMSSVAKLGKILGPKGLMPNPKLGTVTFDVGKVVKELKSGRVEFKSDKGAIVHSIVGRKSLTKEALLENFHVVYDAIMRNKPATSKGIYVLKVFLSSTMGPSVELDVRDLTGSNV